MTRNASANADSTIHRGITGRRTGTIWKSHRTLCGALLVFATCICFHVARASQVGLRGWDDGAITLAFARTFADTGRISVTPSSEVVEGFSSPYWFLQMAFVHSTFGTDFEGSILASQLVSTMFAALSAVLLYILLQTRLGQWACPVSIATLVCSPFLRETSNGMEMTALTTVVLAIAILVGVRREHVWVALAACAAIVPLVRLEAAFYVATAGAAVVLLTRNKKGGIALVLGAALSVASLSLLRFYFFHAWVPNTMLAKQWAPYRPSSVTAILRSTCYVIIEVGFLLVPAVVALLIVIFLTQTRPSFKAVLCAVRARDANAVAVFCVVYVLAAAASCIALGKVDGYLGRMAISILPVAVSGVVYALPSSITSGPPLRLRRKPPLVPCAVISLMLVAFILHTGRTLVRTTSWGDLTAASVTPEKFRRTGQSLDALRTRLGRDTLVVLIPDVGGTALCCEKLHILDLALLTNATLSHTGYRDMKTYIRGQYPDVIETHQYWSRESRLYDDHFFRDNYTPIVAGGIWLHLRNDLLAEISAACTPASVDATKMATYRGSPIDEEYIRSTHISNVCVIAE
jgi:hypothetical protein